MVGCASIVNETTQPIKVDTLTSDGKLEAYEDVASGMIREIREEAGIEVTAMQFRGTISWPDAYYAADAHATNLLAIAESGQKKGCAPAVLPTIPWSARKDEATRVSGPSAYFPSYDEPEFDDLERELAKASVPGPPCPATP